jgi:hypothetical protein
VNKPTRLKHLVPLFCRNAIFYLSFLPQTHARGIVPELLKVIPMAGITFGTYKVLKKCSEYHSWGVFFAFQPSSTFLSVKAVKQHLDETYRD